MNEHASFAALLKRYRMAAGLTQEKLAERANLSVRGISNLERGVRHVPQHATIGLLAEALHLTGPRRATFEAAARARSALSPTRCQPRLGSTLPPLVGRTRERAVLECHLAGEGAPVLVLAGEPGIGKSRLLYEAIQQAEASGWTVLPGGCQRRGGQEPYAPLLQALESHIHRQSPAHLRASLRGCAWLVRLLPELAAGPIEPLPAWAVPPEQERRLMFGAVAHYLADVAGPAGTLLLLDDLQWAGSDALDLLATLLRATGASGPPLRVVGAYRDTEVRPQDPLAVTLADLASAGLATQHTLGPLAPLDAADLVDTLLPDTAPVDRALRERVVQRTGGVPFFLVSCAQGLRAPTGGSSAEELVPWDVAQGVRQRVAALPEAVQQVLGMAAVVGRRAPHALLSQGTARPEEEVLTALETARQAGLLAEEDDETYQFAHDLIREVIEADLGAARRAMVHRRVAEALEQVPGEPPVELLAYHYGHSAEQDKAVRYLEQAGDRAASQYANGTAEGYYRELMERLDSLGRTHDSARAREKLGGVLATVARYDEALAMLERAAAVYRAAGDEEGELRTVARVGRAHAWRGTPAQGIARLLPVLESHTADRPSSGLAVVYVVLARLFFYTGRYTDELAAAERAAELARMLSDERILAEAEQRRGVALMMLGQDDALQVLEGAIPRAEAVGDLFVLGRALVAAGAIYLACGEWATSLQYRERAVAVAERMGDPAEIAFMLSLLGWNVFLLGDWRQARHHSERALALLALSDASLAAAYPLHVLGTICLAEGDDAAASRHLEECATLAERSGDLQALRFAQRGLATYDVLAGHPDKARARLEPLLDRPGLAELVVTELLPALAWAHLERGDEAAAGALVQEAIRRATAIPERVTLVAAWRIGGMMATRRECWEDAQQAFQEALCLARAMGYPYEEGRALYECGVMLTCKGAAQGSLWETWPQARERLEAALAIFRQLGARRDARRAEQALQNPPEESQPL